MQWQSEELAGCSASCCAVEVLMARGGGREPAVQARCGKMLSPEPQNVINRQCKAGQGRQ